MTAQFEILRAIQSKIPDDPYARNSALFNDFLQKLGLYLADYFSLGSTDADLTDPRREVDQIISTVVGQDISLAALGLNIESRFATAVYDFLKIYGVNPIEAQPLEKLLAGYTELFTNGSPWTKVDDGNKLLQFLRSNLLLTAASKGDIDSVAEYSMQFCYSDKVEVCAMSLCAHAANNDSAHGLGLTADWLSPKPWVKNSKMPESEIFAECSLFLTLAAFKCDSTKTSNVFEWYIRETYQRSHWRYGDLMYNAQTPREQVTQELLFELLSELQRSMKTDPLNDPEFLQQWIEMDGSPKDYMQLLANKIPEIKTLIETGERNFNIAILDQSAVMVCTHTQQVQH